jgi:predicted metallo-beta-lactamase superfamily hydrolase
MKDIDQKLDKIIDSISEINVTLGKQSVILDEHIRRTNILEEKIEPVEKHVHRVEGAFKLFSLMGVLLAILEGTRRMLNK